MSWSLAAPKTWAEVVSAVEHGRVFYSKQLGIQGVATLSVTERPEDIVYAVARDGIILAWITRDGKVLVAPGIELVPGTYRFSVGRLMPALRVLSQRTIGGEA
jgi:hypothetical protein